jgi:flagellar FliL protein
MSKKALIIIIFSAVILFMGMMGAGFFVLWTKMSAAVAQVQGGQGAAETEAAAEEEPEATTLGTIYKLETMIVNLADKDGKRYLRITMELELKNPDLIKEIEMRLPQLRDSILMILPTKFYEDIGTTPGKIALRDELIARLNSFLKTGQITTIYFTEFVVQ